MESEYVRRMMDINNQASQDKISPDERVRRIIKEAIEYNSSLINHEDQYVVLSVDGTDYNMFPYGSFQDVEEARRYAQKKRMMKDYFQTPIASQQLSIYLQ